MDLINMMGMEYIIRETKNGKIKGYECWSMKTAILTAISIFLFVLILIPCLKPFFDFDYTAEFYHFFIKVFFYVGLFYVIIIMGRIYFKHKKYQELQSARDFKINGKGYMKKLIVSSIGKYTVDDNSEKGYKFYGHYFVLKDGDVDYYSNAFEGGKLGGVDKETLSKIYNEFGYDYDDRETNKKYVLKEYDKNIEELSYKREQGGLFEKIVNSGKLYFAKTLDRSIIEKGYVPPYIQIGNTKVTVGDSLDVYKDYDNHENYWVDIDFLLKDKDYDDFDRSNHSEQRKKEVMNEIFSTLRNYFK